MSMMAIIRRYVFVGLMVLRITGCPHEAGAAWITFQADAAHTGYVPGRYHFRRATLLWQNAVTSPAYVVNGIAVGGNTVFVTNGVRSFSGDESFHALDQETGALLWSKSFGTGNATTSAPAYSNGIVY